MSLWEKLFGIRSSRGANPAPPEPLRPLESDPAANSFYDAIGRGDLQKVESMLKGTPDLIRSRDNDGRTPLHAAVVGGNKDIATLLLAGGAEVDAADTSGQTPLHNAAFDGDLDLADLLLAHGADINARTQNGRTPLHMAAATQHQHVANLLLARNADVSLRDTTGMAPMQMAAALYLVYSPDRGRGDKIEIEKLEGRTVEEFCRSNAAIELSRHADLESAATAQRRYLDNLKDQKDRGSRSFDDPPISHM